MSAQDGNGIEFDGVDDYIAAIWLAEQFKKLHLAAWINIDVVPDEHDSLSGSVYSTGGVHIAFDSIGRLRLDVNSAAAVHSTRTFGAGDVGNWHHKAITYDIEANYVNFYIDGVLDKSNIFNTVDHLVDLGGTIIGANDDGVSRFFDGKMDDIWYFARALSAFGNPYPKNSFSYSDDFLSITTGTDFSCGIKTDNNMLCWGGIPTVIWGSATT